MTLIFSITTTSVQGDPQPSPFFGLIGRNSWLLILALVCICFVFQRDSSIPDLLARRSLAIEVMEIAMTTMKMMMMMTAAAVGTITMTGSSRYWRREKERRSVRGRGSVYSVHVQSCAAGNLARSARSVKGRITRSLPTNRTITITTTTTIMTTTSLLQSTTPTPTGPPPPTVTPPGEDKTQRMVSSSSQVRRRSSKKLYNMTFSTFLIFIIRVQFWLSNNSKILDEMYKIQDNRERRIFWKV